MYVSVFLHVRLLVEPLPTERARVWPGVTVDQEVGGQCGRPLERLATLGTFEAPLLGVGGSVLVQGHRVTKGFVANLVEGEGGGRGGGKDVY